MLIPCVGAIVRDERGRLLVIQRGRPPGVGLWSIPGGHVEDGESLRGAVRREILEETGIEIHVDAVAGEADLPAVDPADRVHVTDFFARPVDPMAGAHPVAGDDARDVRWVDRAEFDALATTPGLAQTLARWHAWPAP